MYDKARHEIDKFVGSKVRQRRIMLGMSQEKLGVALDFTFQQIQKYEKGRNRISAGTLVMMTRILKAPISFFLPPDDVDALMPDDVNNLTAFLATTEGVAINVAFMKIAAPGTRRAIIDLCEKLTAVPMAVGLERALIVAGVDP